MPDLAKMNAIYREIIDRAFDRCHRQEVVAAMDVMYAKLCVSPLQKAWRQRQQQRQALCKDCNDKALKNRDFCADCWQRERWLSERED